MKVVITGGAGFIGSHLAEALNRRGDEVLVVDDYSTGRRENLADLLGAPGFAVAEADVCGPEAAEAVRAFRPDAVVLLAAQMSVKVSMRDPQFDARVNVLGLLAMLEAARSSGCAKVVFASSGGTIYGSAESADLAFDESTPRAPLSFYGVTKSAAVDYLRIYREQYSLSYAALALGNVYGPRQDPGGEAGVVAIFAQRSLDGVECVVNGDGLNTRDYVYVGDVVEAFTAAIGAGEGLINIGRGVSSTVLDVYRAVAAAVGTEAPARFAPALPGEVRHVRLDVSRAQRELGWRARTDLETGVRRTVDWLRAAALGRRAEIAAAP